MDVRLEHRRRAAAKEAPPASRLPPANKAWSRARPVGERGRAAGPRAGRARQRLTLLRLATDHRNRSVRRRCRRRRRVHVIGDRAVAVAGRTRPGLRGRHPVARRAGHAHARTVGTIAIRQASARAEHRQPITATRDHPGRLDRDDIPARSGGGLPGACAQQPPHATSAVRVERQPQGPCGVASVDVDTRRRALPGCRSGELERLRLSAANKVVLRLDRRIAQRPARQRAYHALSGVACEIRADVRGSESRRGERDNERRAPASHTTLTERGRPRSRRRPARLTFPATMASRVSPSHDEGSDEAEACDAPSRSCPQFPGHSP